MFFIISATLMTATITLAWSGNSNTETRVAYDFETSDSLGPFYACSVKAPSGAWQASGDTYEGNGKLDVFFDEAGYDGTRDDRGSEICSNTAVNFGKEGWIGFAMNVPSGEYPYDADTIVAQLFCSGGCSSWCGVLHIDQNSLAVEYRGDCSPDAPYSIIVSEIARDSWHSVLMHMRTSSQSDGALEVWWDGDQVFSVTGINLAFGDSWDSADSVTPQVSFKNGMYAANTKSYNNGTRNLYFDRITWFDADGSDLDGFAVASP